MNSLNLNVYKGKPKRRISGTRCVAVTMYRSEDGSVAYYGVFTEDGEAYLGNAHYHPKTRFSPRCYTMNAGYSRRDEHWPNLSTFAVEMAKRNGLEVSLP